MPDLDRHMVIEENAGSGDVYSKVVKAGRRTYFMDIKSTRDDDWFVVITESRKIKGKDGIPLL